MQSKTDLEVYHFRGKDGEEIPAGVGKLIVGPGLQILHDTYCSEKPGLQEVILCEGLIKIGTEAFVYCSQLLTIDICSTVQSME
mmetsp:Transcript_24727/g.60752  ORF Transcript_24727/g.60752 Transcript_24727/m.60752 type:complete len:84 (+) Transcript_24727:123-374(+)